MVFNSNLFIFLLLPVCLFFYYFLLKKERGAWAKYSLIAVSLLFYGYYDPWLLLGLGGSVVYNLLILGRLEKWGKPAMVLGVLGNLFLLFYCRYSGVVLLLGVSFFTFQQISFLVDAYRGEVERYSISDYILFVLYFPKLLQGPIALHSELLPQFQHLEKIRFNPETFYRGVVLFILGMAKKVLLAETLGSAVNYGYSNLAALYTADALIVMLSYTLQLYFDFSGYCDMAMGVSRMLGIELPVNFNSPYKSADIIQFWRGWHITLTRFLTKYIYIPLGGNRRGSIRTYVNLLLVFLVSGLWHGAGITFIIWGMMHGILYVFTRLTQKKKTHMAAGKQLWGRITLTQEQQKEQYEAAEKQLWRRICRTAATFIYINIAWVFFRASSVKEAITLLQKIIEFRWQKIEHDLVACFNVEEFWYVIKVFHIDRWQYGYYILTIFFLLASLLLVFFGKNALQIAEKCRPNLINTIGLSILFAWCVLSLSGVSTFIYLNF